MDIIEASMAIYHIAQESGVSVDVIIKEMEDAITEAMENPDPIIQERWKKIPRRGKKPTALEFVAYMRSIVHK